MRSHVYGAGAAARPRRHCDRLDWCVDYLYRIGKPQIAKANCQEPVDDPASCSTQTSSSPTSVGSRSVMLRCRRQRLRGWRGPLETHGGSALLIPTAPRRRRGSAPAPPPGPCPSRPPTRGARTRPLDRHAGVRYGLPELAFGHERTLDFPAKRAPVVVALDRRHPAAAALRRSRQPELALEITHAYCPRGWSRRTGPLLPRTCAIPRLVLVGRAPAPLTPALARLYGLQQLHDGHDHYL